jgi:membrane protease YdiL (CAAX protease family)
MKEAPDTTPRAIPATILLHQEGVVAIVALVGLSMRAEDVADGLAPRGTAVASVFTGLVIGLACAAGVLILRRLPALAALEMWQRHMVRGWSLTDAVAVSVFSGLAEEALVRALLQPVIGLLPAALIFAALHLVPDRRLWLWPVLALVLGVILGVIFNLGGYPAAATAHITINGFALIRLQRVARE